MSRGNHILSCRVPADLLQEIRDALESHNQITRADPWALSDLVQKALRDWLDHRERSRRAKKKPKPKQCDMENWQEEFDRAWNWVEMTGSCDGIGGAEYKRVKEEFELSIVDREFFAMTVFIRLRANVDCNGRTKASELPAILRTNPHDASIIETF